MFTKSQYQILFSSIRPFEPRKLSIQHFYQLFVKKRGEMNLTNGAVAIEIDHIVATALMAGKAKIARKVK